MSRSLKLLAQDDEARPQDRADLRALRLVATQEDLDRARVAIGLIAERGYHRDRDLTVAMAAAFQG